MTIRGEDGKELLKRLFEAKGNRVNGRSFDNMGNVSFGILEHIDIPGIKYDPKIGILGLDISIKQVLENITRLHLMKQRHILQKNLE